MFIGALIYIIALSPIQSDSTSEINSTYVIKVLKIVNEFQTGSDQKKRKSFGLEFSGGLTVGEFEGSASGLEYNPDTNWKISVIYSPLKWAALNIGYSQVKFRCSSGFCRNTNVIFTGTGIEGGFQLIFWGLWIGAGMIKHDLQFNWSENDFKRELKSDESKWGMDLKAGTMIKLSRTFALNIGGRYAIFDIKVPNEQRFFGVNYISGEVGMRIYFFLRKIKF